jgi:hypothetical protein
MFYRFKGARKTGESPLHPQPKDWGIRDPLHFRSNNFRVESFGSMGDILAQSVMALLQK